MLNLKNKRIHSMILAIALGTSVIASQSLAAAVTTTPTYNYGEALQKSLMFYEFQRSGKLPTDKRDNWRGDSALNDGSDVGLDLTGGWYDAGDHIKFNLPMSYTAAMLGWSLYENKDAYVKSGQLTYAVNNIKWVSDYLMKCHPSADVFYYQVGEGGADHKWWGPAEVMQMARPSYKLDIEHPGSTVVAESAAALAVAATVLKDSDPVYAAKCLEHAKQLFAFADKTKSDKGYVAASSYYDSWSGYYDELSWSATWLYLATKDSAYLTKAESYVPNWKVENQTTTIAYRWAHCWDDVHYGAQLLLARITNKSIYKESVERSLDYWSTGYNDGNGLQRIKYTPKGLAWMDSWGSLRYATTMGFLADVYASSTACTASKVKAYQDFAKSQIDYALGSTGKSFEVGFGVNPPEHVHHRTAQGSWFDKSIVPTYSRHILYGALAGGPDATDGYTDEIDNFTNNEVACDYNAGFVGLLARTYDKFGGTPIPNFKTIEPITNTEMYVEAGVNATGPNFVEIKALLYNKSGWPGRMGDKLSYRYFVDISELAAKGFGPKDVTMTVNYNTGGVVSNLLPWDVEKNIYYVNVDFTGVKVYPGGQSDHKKEIQFRIAGPKDVNVWDNSNDFSYVGINTTPGEAPLLAENISVYDNGKKVYGKEPVSTLKLMGDVNGDGIVNNFDVVAVKKYILGLNPNMDITVADLNNDGQINIIDYIKLKKSII